MAHRRVAGLPLTIGAAATVEVSRCRRSRRPGSCAPSSAVPAATAAPSPSTLRLHRGACPDPRRGLRGSSRRRRAPAPRSRVRHASPNRRPARRRRSMARWPHGDPPPEMRPQVHVGAVARPTARGRTRRAPCPRACRSAPAGTSPACPGRASRHRRANPNTGWPASITRREDVALDRDAARRRATVAEHLRGRADTCPR